MFSALPYSGIMPYAPHILVHATFTIWFKVPLPRWVPMLPLSFDTSYTFYHFHQISLCFLHISSTNYITLTFSLHDENTKAQGFKTLGKNNYSFFFLREPSISFVIHIIYLQSYSLPQWHTTSLSNQTPYLFGIQYISF